MHSVARLPGCPVPWFGGCSVTQVARSRRLVGLRRLVGSRRSLGSFGHRPGAPVTSAQPWSPRSPRSPRSLGHWGARLPRLSSAAQVTQVARPLGRPVAQWPRLPRLSRSPSSLGYPVLRFGGPVVMTVWSGRVMVSCRCSSRVTVQPVSWILWWWCTQTGNKLLRSVSPALLHQMM
jgi:hypothetical protein